MAVCRPTNAPAQPGLATSRSDQHYPFHPRGDGAAAWAKTEASASFWTIGDATAPGAKLCSPALPHPAPVDDRRGVGRLLSSCRLTGTYWDMQRCADVIVSVGSLSLRANTALSVLWASRSPALILHFC